MEGGSCSDINWKSSSNCSFEVAMNIPKLSLKGLFEDRFF